jgi:hypothetical protein
VTELGPHSRASQASFGASPIISGTMAAPIRFDREEGHFVAVHPDLRHSTGASSRLTSRYFTTWPKDSTGF